MPTIVQVKLRPKNKTALCTERNSSNKKKKSYSKPVLLISFPFQQQTVTPTTSSPRERETGPGKSHQPPVTSPSPVSVTCSGRLLWIRTLKPRQESISGALVRGVTFDEVHKGERGIKESNKSNRNSA